MRVRFESLIGVGLGSALSLAVGQTLAAENDFEVWVTEQSGTAGKLYIYPGKALIKDPATARPEVVDLGGAVGAMCTADTGAAPTRAHIALFNASASVAILAYVASGHVVFVDAASRAPIKCLRMSPGAINPATGQPFRQAHAAFPAPNQRYVVVANQNGRLLERIDTDADADGKPYEDAADIVHDTAATLNLATCTTAGGAACQQEGVRPVNNVVCPIIDDGSALSFITLSGGGLLVADTRAGKAPPPVVAAYDMATVHGNGCGGMQASTQAGGKIYLNSGASTGNPDEYDLYAFPAEPVKYAAANPPNAPAPKPLFSFDGMPPVNDSHGMALVGAKDRYLWVNDRALNEVQVVDTRDDTLVGRFGLAAAASADPAPDLMATDPDGKHVFVTLRGPCPLTANDPSVNNAVGATPGLMVIKVEQGGKAGEVLGVAPISDPAPAAFDCPSRGDDTPNGTPTLSERADPHGIAVRALGKGSRN